MYRQAVARRQRLLLRLHRQPRYGNADSHSYTDGHCNYYAERYSYRYAKADAHAAIRTDAQAASHPAAEALTVTGR